LFAINFYSFSDLIFRKALANTNTQFAHKNSVHFNLFRFFVVVQSVFFTWRDFMLFPIGNCIFRIFYINFPCALFQETENFFPCALFQNKCNKNEEQVEQKRQNKEIQQTDNNKGGKD